MKQNLTVSLDSEIIRRAKVLAAQRNTSISRLVAEELENLTERAERYEQARQRALRRLETGWSLGGQPLSREQAHRRT